MKFDYTVKYNGKKYFPGEDVPMDEPKAEEVTETVTETVKADTMGDEEIPKNNKGRKKKSS